MGGVLIRQASQREGPVGALQFKRLRGAESTLPAFLLQGLVFSAVWFALGALVCYVVQQAGGAATAAATPLVALSPDRHHAVPCTLPAQATANRKNLVFAAVGDGWTPDM